MAGYPNSWPGWATDVLKAAKLPVTPANITFLDIWHSYEGSAAANNPLNTTAYAPAPETVGYKTLNKDGVQYYATPAKGAAATAAFLGMSNFSAIRAGLASGDIYAYSAKSAANATNIADALAHWGSHSFALVFQYEAPPPAMGFQGVGGKIVESLTGAPTTTINQSHTDPATGKSTNSTTTGGTGSDIFSGLENWASSKGKLALAYLLLIGVAGGLLLMGAKGLGVPTPKMPNVVPVPA